MNFIFKHLHSCSKKAQKKEDRRREKELRKASAQKLDEFQEREENEDSASAIHQEKHAEEENKISVPIVAGR